MMKRKFEKLVSVIATCALTMGILVGCGAGNNAASAPADTATAETKEAETTGAADTGKAIKVGVLVADVSGEEAQGFRSYYENYIAKNYNVEFNYTDALASAEEEKSAIEKFVSQGCDAIISLSSSDRAMQLETCEEYGVYYAIASGVLDEEQYSTYKSNEHFVCQIGPSNETEFIAGKEMGEYFKHPDHKLREVR